ncbi:NAD(+) synthase [Mycoplasmopsis ciconiae]|uniref:NH(3)-dependent NAD(+) synthetase n=1 Tax=Mycoplasmopsis ciconiae TaxID=561067 RepID=A0ABU7MLV0_9BACT|nr:NAD(+) synthase [Mycoplasmopsis ciconiae]
MKISQYNGKKISFNKENALKYIDTLVEFLQTSVKRAKAKGLIVGISGGIDSALVVALAKKAFPTSTYGVIMPINNMDFDMPHIKKLEQNLGMNFLEVNLEKVKKEFDNVLNLTNNLAIANIMPRLRMTTLYALAQENNLLVAGTDNLDEYYIGYFTKHGDGGVDLLPISHLTKSEVRYLASLLNVPEEIILKKPSAGLWEGQSDEDELGITYNDIDFYLSHLDNKEEISKNLNSDIIERIQKLHTNSQHKRDGAYRPLSPQEIK